MDKNIVSIVLCDFTIEYKSPFSSSGYIYERCKKAAKYRIKYIEAARSITVEKNVCGTHFRSAQKNSLRLKNKFNYDNKLTWNIL